MARSILHSSLVFFSFLSFFISIDQFNKCVSVSLSSLVATKQQQQQQYTHRVSLFLSLVHESISVNISICYISISCFFFSSARNLGSNRVAFICSLFKPMIKHEFFFSLQQCNGFYIYTHTYTHTFEVRAQRTTKNISFNLSFLIRSVFLSCNSVYNSILNL